MQVSTICNRDIVTIDAQCSLMEAARMMRDHHVGMLVVTCTDAGGEQVCGIVTDRDLVVDALARTPLELDVEVGDLAHVDLTLIAENASLGQAVVAMQDSGVRRLLVTDGEHRLSGIVSLDDVIEACAEQVGGLAAIIRNGMDRELAMHTPKADPGKAPSLPGAPETRQEHWTRVVV
ncbi:MAG: CBS domain-containing protein [Hydrogenophaga sp.]|jgi:predicted transcriptional regulator|nr:CBS domain-containing protein [Hydrogenophaga sp.]MDP3323551.1 CBS domain-containing protein [Hydrogenophaga sp.]